MSDVYEFIECDAYILEFRSVPEPRKEVSIEGGTDQAKVLQVLLVQVIKYLQA